MKLHLKSLVLIIGVLAVSLVVTTCSKNAVGDDEVIDDGTAPKTVSDLAVASFSDTSVTLTWTATGDDSTIGTAASYDLRIAGAMIHWGNFDSASAVPGLPGPKPSGESEQFEIRGLETDSTYYFALRVSDESGNYEGVSNCVEVTCYNDYIVNMPDTSLKAAVREQIGKPAGDIMKSDLYGMYDLLASDRSIADLTGLECCANLSVLDISNNAVTDLAPISGLNTLLQLRFGGNSVSDITPIAGLTNLNSLQMWSNRISDISAVSAMTHLTILYIYNNQVINLTPLESLTDLHWLSLKNNQISDIAPLSYLTNLTELDLSYNAIVDVSPLSNLTYLGYLDIGYNRIRDISPLVANSGIGSGDIISLILDPLEHESIMSHIPALRARGATVHWVDNTIVPGAVTDLSVESTTASTVTLTWSAPGEDFFEGTAFRYEIRYSKNESDILSWSGGQTVSSPPDPDTAGTVQSVVVSGLAEDTLYYFGLRTQDNSDNWSTVSNITWGRPYQDVVVTFSDAALEGAIRDAVAKPTGDIYKSELSALDSLIAEDEGISDLAGIEYCINLSKLNLTDNNVSDIAPLAQLVGLRDVNLQGNSVSDITPLSGLNSLWILQLTGNPIGDLDPLASLGNMWFLSVNFAGLTDLQAVASMPKIEYLFVIGNNISDLSPLTGCPLLNTIYADNNPISDISALSDLVLLTNVWLRNDLIQDISPLVNNSGIGAGDQVGLSNNPLSTESINTYIPALEARGVVITH
ncbi:MAG TPA: leucine-rich repeat domain-containing protein [candidate division Zixibacteria bacterium]|nr:leucine-rich repeat domain-containing protein [candidate division Zixibacteria bacterium]